MVALVDMGLQLMYKYKLVIVIIAVLNITYLLYDVEFFYTKSTDFNLDIYDGRRYIVDTPGCRIENLNAFSDEIKDYIYKVKKISCSTKDLLTYVTRTRNDVILNINSSLLNAYSLFKVSCCYSSIRRNTVGPNPDDNLIFSDCVPFADSVVIRDNFIKVECRNFLHNVYENVHSTLQRPEKLASNKAAPNVLLVGIDGVSTSNLIRSMPKTFQFCEDNKWVGLKGYNKIADNTFPNLMAVLTGMNHEQAGSVCNPYDKEKLNSCRDFVWWMYKGQNYSTAYAEDTPSIATFNGPKVGFADPPTDYYFRPYFLAADQLSARYLCLKAHCTGPEKTGIRMQNLIKDFLATTEDITPAFGLFWMNSFSHEDVNCPSSMDDEFASFFEDLKRSGSLDNTILVLFSDHGFRFGKIRLTHTGWMEERLPFIYIWIPDRFRLQHQEEFKNLQENSEKLTSPYNLHMTLQHILSLSNRSFVETPSRGCPDCQSLLKPINASGTCHDSGIPQHYCTCSKYEKVSVHSPLILQVAEFFVKRLNEIVASYGDESAGCSRYYLTRITHAKSLVIREGVEENILLGVVTNPEAIFEATVKVEGNGTKFTLMETNRLDRYAPKTFCVQNSPVQMYCYCKSILRRVTNIFCNNKFCFL